MKEAFRFTSVNFVLHIDDEYDALKARVAGPQLLALRREIRQLESYLLDGLAATLNDSYLKIKSPSFSTAACFWFAKMVRSMIVARLRLPLDRTELARVAYGQDAVYDPFASWADMESLFGSKMIKLDFWTETDPRQIRSAWVPVTGYAGEFISKNLCCEKYQHHYSPVEYYKFILPQFVYGSFVNKEPVIDAATLATWMVGPS
jgi:hypothetical protein